MISSAFCVLKKECLYHSTRQRWITAIYHSLSISQGISFSSYYNSCLPSYRSHNHSTEKTFNHK